MQPMPEKNPSVNATKAAIAAAASNATAPVAQAPSFAGYLANNKKAFESVLPTALRKQGGVDRFLRLALSAVARTPQLLNCSMESIAGALMQSAVLGLEPNTPLGQAHVIPFKNKKKGITEAQFVIGYQGLLDLAYRSGLVSSIMAQPVYRGDFFEYHYGRGADLKHIPRAKTTTVEDITDAYAYAETKNGFIFLAWPIAKVWHIRDTYSASYKNDPELSPWASSPESMIQKTMLRHLFPFLPRSIEIMQALAADESITDPFDPKATPVDLGIIATTE